MKLPWRRRVLRGLIWPLRRYRGWQWEQRVLSGQIDLAEAIDGFVAAQVIRRWIGTDKDSTAIPTRPVAGSTGPPRARRRVARWLRKEDLVNATADAAVRGLLREPVPALLDVLDGLLANGDTLTTREALLRAELLWLAARDTAALLQWHAIAQEMAEEVEVHERWAQRDPSVLAASAARAHATALLERTAAVRESEQGDATRITLRPFPRQRGMQGVYAWWQDRRGALQRYADVADMRAMPLLEDDILLDHDLDAALLARIRVALRQVPAVSRVWIARRHRPSAPTVRMLVFWLGRRSTIDEDLRRSVEKVVCDAVPDLPDDFRAFDDTPMLDDGLRVRLRALEHVTRARVL